MEVETDRELRATAKSMDRSVTWCVRRAVEEWLERRRKEPAVQIDAVASLVGQAWPERKETP